MNIKDALSILGLSKIATQENIKQAYRKACMKYHPDRNPAGLEMMESINVAYQQLIESNYDGSVSPFDGEEGNVNYGDMLNDAINAVIVLDGITIEVCGSWIWLSGDTKKHKDTIKAAGYFWASKKLQWYFRPEDYKSRNHGTWGMDKIRDVYGSSKVIKPDFEKLAY